jgi:hypothetical protein
MDIDGLEKVTRFEVIDDNGRVYSKWDLKDVVLQLQDNGRTLKAFLQLGE